MTKAIQITEAVTNAVSRAVGYQIATSATDAELHTACREAGIRYSDLLEELRL